MNDPAKEAQKRYDDVDKNPKGCLLIGAILFLTIAAYLAWILMQMVKNPGFVW